MSEERTTTGKPKRRKTWRSRLLSYSVRGLLLLVLLICIGLAGYVWLLQDLHEQQAIARELMDAGCQVEWYSYHTSPAAREAPAWPLWLIDLIGVDPDAQLFEVYCLCKSEAQLQIVLDAVERLPYIRDLKIGGHLRGFRALPRIKRLYLVTGLYEGSLHEVSRMTSLEELILHGRPNDQDLNELSDLPNLISLSLTGDGITSDCLPAIVELKSLEDLDLNGTSVTDRDLEILHELPRLHDLDLRNTRITDAAIPKLSKMIQLETLAVGDHDDVQTWTYMTEEGIKRLKRALPNTRIYLGTDVFE